ncbi:hypothetical protein ACFW04_014046 [Cataglyphis niger]
MKGITRRHCWWSGMNKDIQTLIENCSACNTFKNNPPKVEQHVWEFLAAPMHRLHADFAGPFIGHWFFIIVDAYSKWPEVRIVKNITAKTVIEECRGFFAMNGVTIFVIDNGKTFTSAEFKAFLEQNRTLKNALRRVNVNATNVSKKLCKMLLYYHIVPHATTNKFPAKLFLGRKLGTRLDLLFPRKEKDNTYTTYHYNSRSFKIGKRVSYKNFVDHKNGNSVELRTVTGNFII